MPLIIPANTLAVTGAYQVSNSVRFDKADGAALTFTPDSTTDREKSTFSAWIKPSAVSGVNSFAILGWGTDYAGAKFTDNPGVSMLFKPDGKHQSWFYGDWKADPAAWQHWMFSWDTAQATAANRGRVWRNGVEVTTEYSSNDPVEGIDMDINLSGTPMYLGRAANPSAVAREWYDGLMAEVAWIDGQQITDPTTFGKFNSDSPTIWQPIDFKDSVTFGDNGFYLEFKENGTGADANGLGADTSGNNNHFTLENLAATDQSKDTPTNNFCTMNPLDNYFHGTTFTQCNTKIVTSAASIDYNAGTIGLSKGKWYFEVLVHTAADGGGTDLVQIGIANKGGVNHLMGDGAVGEYGYYGNGGAIIHSSGTQTAYGAGYTDGDIIGCFFDLDNNKLYFAKNNAIQASGTGFDITAAASNGTGFYLPAIGENATARDGYTGVLTASLNFGAGALGTTAISSAVADANGYGAFEYDPSDGGSSSFDSAAKDFLAICTQNIAENGG